MKKKLKLLPRLRKELVKGFLRIKWFLITNFIFYSRLIFARKYKKLNKIAILIPSKQRVKKLNRLIDSLKDKTDNKNRIFLLILIDENEIYKEDYILYVKKMSKELNIKLYFRDESTHNLRNNFLASKINADLYFPLNDDVIFIMKGWDSYLDEISSMTPLNKAFSIWTTSTSKYHYLHSEFPIVNYKWFKNLGYIGNLYLFGYIDTWICDLGKNSKKFILAKKKIY